LAKSIIVTDEGPLAVAVDNLEDWITDYAAEEMADAVLVDLRKVGKL
jgi:hypothetical protein